MSYSICGLIVPQVEERVCSGQEWPFVTLAGGVSLIPLQRDYLLLVDGDETRSAEKFQFEIPQWLLDMLQHFSRCAYIEAEFWGGDGMQASFVWDRDRIVSGPEISTGAINSALRGMGIEDGPSVSLGGLPLTHGKDPFDIVGLGRHRSVDGWLR